MHFSGDSVRFGAIFAAPDNPARPPEHLMVKDAVTCRRTTEEGKVRWSEVQVGAQCTQAPSVGRKRTRSGSKLPSASYRSGSWKGGVQKMILLL